MTTIVDNGAFKARTDAEAAIKTIDACKSDLDDDWARQPSAASRARAACCGFPIAKMSLSWMRRKRKPPVHFGADA